MANPSVTVQISAKDEASQAFQQMASNARQAAKALSEMANVKGGNVATFARDNADALKRASDAASGYVRHLQSIKSALGDLARIKAASTLANVPEKVKEAINHYVPTEKTLTTIKATGNYDAASIEKLRKQHVELANAYGEKPEATAHAQEAVARRGFNIPKTLLFTNEAARTSKAIGSNVAEAATALEGVIFGRGEHVDNEAQLQARLRYYSDRFAYGAKKGALSHTDLEDINKYGSAGLNAANVSYEKQMAMGMLLKRENFGGSEAGIFMRALADRVMRPTNEGRIALDSAGIRYDRYTGMGNLSAENMNLTLERYLGKKVSPAEVARVQKAISEGAIKTSGDFSKAVVEAYEQTHGKQKAADTNRIAKQAQRVFSASQGQVDGDRLLSDIFSSMSPQQIMGFLGVKQGTKGAAIISQLKQAQEWEAEMKGGKADGYRDQVAGQRTQGLGAAQDRANASAEARNNELVEAWTGPLQKLYNAYTKINTGISNLEQPDKQLLTIGGAAGAALLAKGMYGWAKGQITQVLHPGMTPQATGPGLISTGIDAMGALGRFVGANLGATLGPFVVSAAATAAMESDDKMRNRSRAYFSIPPEDWEAAHRKTQQWRSDPEGARGEAFNNLTRRPLPDDVQANINAARPPNMEAVNSAIAGVKEAINGINLQPVNVSGTVEGKGELAIHMTGSLTADAGLQAKLNKIDGLTKAIPLFGQLGNTMGGANGVRPPEK